MAVSEESEASSKKVTVKVGMLGEPKCGKSILMRRYMDQTMDEDFVETLGVNFLEKTIQLGGLEVTISVWDLGGQKEFAVLMPLVCAEAKVMLFVFDLTSEESLTGIRKWYKETRKESKTIAPMLIGTKYDLFEKMPDKVKQQRSEQSREYASKMKAPLIYCSSQDSINVKKIFKIVLAKVFGLKPKIEEHSDELTGPLCEYRVALGLDSADSSSETTAVESMTTKKATSAAEE